LSSNCFIMSSNPWNCWVNPLMLVAICASSLEGLCDGAWSIRQLPKKNLQGSQVPIVVF
jgi:hypothetical protein